jgi:hypothetical protein
MGKGSILEARSFVGDPGFEHVAWNNSLSDEVAMGEFDT